MSQIVAAAPNASSSPAAATAAAVAVADEEAEQQQSRAICWDGCGRPSTVCLCPYLPATPIPTATRLLILHHPHALRRNPLATVPLLARCLLNAHALPGRRLRSASSPLLLSPTILYLFPGPNATDLARWAHETSPDVRASTVLVVFDGTWQHAREMVAASMPVLSGIHAKQVSFGRYDEAAEGDSTFESELVLRKEPFRGCVSTMEAVARALRILETDGAEVEERLLSVLRAMVRFQAQHLKPMKPRPKLRKKKEMRKANEENAGVVAVDGEGVETNSVAIMEERIVM